MNRFFQFSAFLILCSLFLATSCKKDDDGSSCGDNFNYALELQAESSNLSAAAQTYAQDQTQENCEAYKTAVQNYLNAAADLDNCVPVGDRAAYQQAIDDSQDSLDALQC
ncbi:MAG: hypothetical protein DHS20C18_00790 [Saprospiraceae bacterium]|nr:MAG: hypothetical protein DHS20C18_00790 [Saprospiraceae bacterium]